LHNPPLISDLRMIKLVYFLPNTSSLVGAKKLRIFHGLLYLWP
jgi:hypothetical protein